MSANGSDAERRGVAPPAADLLRSLGERTTPAPPLPALPPLPDRGRDLQGPTAAPEAPRRATPPLGSLSGALSGILGGGPGGRPTPAPAAAPTASPPRGEGADGAADEPPPGASRADGRLPDEGGTPPVDRGGRAPLSGARAAQGEAPPAASPAAAPAPASAPMSPPPPLAQGGDIEAWPVYADQQRTYVAVADEASEPAGPERTGEVPRDAALAAALEASLETTPPVPIPALAFDEARVQTPRPHPAATESAELRALREAQVADDDGDADGDADPQAKGEAVPAQIGRFSVLQRLGSGGMGVVYAAYDPELDRRVALKVLRAQVSQSSSSSTARARLLREAKALAKLSHPNVVAVYDVGTVDDQVFIAMEFVKGTTLTRWEREGEGGQGDKRTWQEVLALFLQAGRGLAAAHKAGIIHRDFKPDNVLIGRDGRVRVVDFGLARADSRGQERPDTFADAIKSLNQQSSSVFELRLTRTGGMAGTPAYMAPEQYLNLQVDARTDQFSYCVALYEGLYGQRPFVGDTVARVRKAVINGDIAEAPRDSDVPQWLRKILIRGLSVHPGARYPSMDALLAELSDDPRRPQKSWRRLGALAVTVVGAAAIAWSQLGARRSGHLLDRPGCRIGLAALGDAYNSRRKEAIAAAFAASGHPEATQIWRRVDGLLGEYVDEWSRTQLRVCTVDHFEPGHQSPFVALHQRCLDRRLGPLRALAGGLADADPRTLVHAVPAAHALLALRPCSDPSTLRLGVDEPEVEGVVALGNTLRSQLDHADAMRWLGRGAEALEVVRATTTEAARIDHLPVRAEAYLLQGTLEEALGDYEAAERSLKEALWSAEASRHDEVAIDALTLLVRVLGVHLGRHDDAGQLHPRLTAAVRRLGDPRREAEAHRSFGLAAAAQGHAEAAVVRLESALEFAASVPGPHGRHVAAELRVDLGRALRQAGRLGESATALQKAIEALEASAGTNHPVVAEGTLELCETLLAQGDLTRAMRSCRRALDLREEPAIQPHLRAAARFALARLHWQAKRTSEALALARQARDELTGAGALGKRPLEAVNAWLREHGR